MTTEMGESAVVAALPSPERRIVDAALRCFAHYGVAKTTFEDIAREAGCSRATVYRYFPGKESLLEGVKRAEIVRLAHEFEPRAASAASLEELLVSTLHYVGTEFAGHRAVGPTSWAA